MYAISAAEKKAGVTHRPRRGSHGLRKMVAGDVYEATKDIKSAMNFIGDSEVLAPKYLKRRMNRLMDAASKVDEMFAVAV